MPRIGIVNILIGFLAILLASCGGFFLATEADKAFLLNQQLLSSWQYTLLKSAHGHLNLFGMLHILVGLSIPYSKLSKTFLFVQTGGLFLGTLTMGVFLLFRAFAGLPQGSDIFGIFIGVNLSAALGALVLHCYGLSLKLFR